MGTLCTQFRNSRKFFGSLIEGLKAKDLKNEDSGTNVQPVSFSPPPSPSVIRLRIIECGPAKCRGFLNFR